MFFPQMNIQVYKLKLKIKLKFLPAKFQSLGGILNYKESFTANQILI